MTTSTLAAVLREPRGLFNFESLTLDEPRSDEVVVRMVACGICQTDAHFRDQHMPIELPAVLGHEGAGVVVKIGDAVTSVAPGDHVVLSFNSCGQCVTCRRGHPAYCENLMPLNFSGVRPDGTPGMSDEMGRPVRGRFFGQSSFATFTLASERCVVKVPKAIPLPLLAPLGCGVQTGAAAVLNALDVRPGSSVAVFGVGAVGLAAIMASKVAKAKSVIAIDVNPKRLALALELGAHHVIDPRGIDTVSAIRQFVPRGVDYVLDTSGRKESLDAGLAAMAFMGKFGFVAFSPASGAVLDASRLTPGQSLHGIIQGDAIPQAFIPKLVELYRSGVFPIDKLIRYYEPSKINDALSDAARGEAAKPVVVFEKQAV